MGFVVKAWLRQSDRILFLGRGNTDVYNSSRRLEIFRFFERPGIAGIELSEWNFRGTLFGRLVIEGLKSTSAYMQNQLITEDSNRGNNVVHATLDLRVFLKWMINRSGSVITDVMSLAGV